jgi:hypothetical protein
VGRGSGEIGQEQVCRTLGGRGGAGGGVRRTNFDKNETKQKQN